MDGLSIIGVAIGVGVIVYALSLRSAKEPIEDRLPPAPGTIRSPLRRLRHRSPPMTGADLGFGPEPEPPERASEPESFVYVPVLHSTEPQWRARVGAVVGLIALIAVAALAVAISMYQLGHVVNQMIGRYLGR